MCWCNVGLQFAGAHSFYNSVVVKLTCEGTCFVMVKAKSCAYDVAYKVWCWKRRQHSHVLMASMESGTTSPRRALLIVIIAVVL